MSAVTKKDFPTDKIVQPAIFFYDQPNLVGLVCDALGDDSVALIRNVPSPNADRLMALVCQNFQLHDRLKLQAGFASIYGHRANVGQYFMTVNKRHDYQWTAAHSEGTSHAGMQMAAFYCRKNTTDGGVTLLFNADDNSPLWPLLRERVIRGISTKPLSQEAITKAKGRYKLSLPNDFLKNGEEVISEISKDIDGLVVVRALAKPVRMYSAILKRWLYTYWDSVANVDANDAYEFYGLLKQFDLLRLPANDLAVEAMDMQGPRRIRNFGVQYESIFKRLVVYKLQSDDMLIFNNTAWSHSASNWTPGSGVRDVVASFA